MNPPMWVKALTVVPRIGKPQWDALDPSGTEVAHLAERLLGTRIASPR